MKITIQRKLALRRTIAQAMRSLTCPHDSFTIQLNNTFVPQFKAQCNDCGEWLNHETSFEAGVVSSVVKQKTLESNNHNATAANIASYRTTY